MNLKDKLQSIGFSLLVTLLLILAIYIVVGLKSSTTNWTLVIIGIVVLAPFLIYLIYQNFLMSHEAEERDKKYEAHLHKFKQTANRVPVNLEKAIIQEKNHYYTKTVVTGKAAALNEISGNGHYNEKTIEYTSCKVTFRLKYNNEELTLERTIKMGETALRMHFYIKKETILYVDPFDSENYHLDLDFIED